MTQTSSRFKTNSIEPLHILKVFIFISKIQPIILVQFIHLTIKKHVNDIVEEI